MFESEQYRVYVIRESDGDGWLIHGSSGNPMWPNNAYGTRLAYWFESIRHMREWAALDGLKQGGPFTYEIMTSQMCVEIMNEEDWAMFYLSHPDLLGSVD